MRLEGLQEGLKLGGVELRQLAGTRQLAGARQHHLVELEHVTGLFRVRGELGEFFVGRDGGNFRSLALELVSKQHLPTLDLV